MTPTFHYYTSSRDSFGILVLTPRTAEGCPMPDCYLNGRPVYYGDYCQDLEEPYFESATYADDDTELSDDELVQLTDDNIEWLVQESYEHMAAAAYDRAKDYRKYGND